jgi:hypothetical protein
MLGLIVAFSGCKKHVAEEPPPEEAPPTATRAPATKEATPAPKPVVVATTPPAATPAPELAPPGVFYLITAVSVETSDGIVGLKPGQLLREVRPGVYRADNNEVTLRPEQITNDLKVARDLAAQEKRTQAAIQQRMAPQSAPPAAAVKTNPGPGTAPTAVTAPPPNPHNAVRDELARQRQAVQAEMARIANAMGPFSTKYGSWDLAAKRSPQAFQIMQQFQAAQRQLTDIDAKLAATPP